MELRFDKQIIEEPFDAKFLCESFHVKIQKLLSRHDSRAVENITKSGTNVSECVRQIFYTSNFDPTNIWIVNAHFLVLIYKEPRDITHMPRLRHNVAVQNLLHEICFIL